MFNYVSKPIHSTHTSHETSLPETHVTHLTKVMLLILAWQLLQERRSLSEESDVAEEGSPEIISIIGPKSEKKNCKNKSKQDVFVKHHALGTSCQ